MTRLFAVLAILPAVASGADSTANDLSWLAGCWVTPDKSAQEVWVLEADRSLVGLNVVIVDNSVSFYEILTIRPSESGALIYTAHPSGQESASFAAVKITENSIVFTNPNHDYPQQIMYVRDGSRLTATISLLGGAKPNSFDKIACG